jgi:hypothetical protein
LLLRPAGAQTITRQIYKKMDGLTYNLNFTSNGGAIFATINTGLNNVQKTTKKPFDKAHKKVVK